MGVGLRTGPFPPDSKEGKPETLPPAGSHPSPDPLKTLVDWQWPEKQGLTQHSRPLLPPSFSHIPHSPTSRPLLLPLGPPRNRFHVLTTQSHHSLAPHLGRAGLESGSHPGGSERGVAGGPRSSCGRQPRYTATSSLAGSCPCGDTHTGPPHRAALECHARSLLGWGWTALALRPLLFAEGAPRPRRGGRGRGAQSRADPILAN